MRGTSVTARIIELADAQQRAVTRRQLRARGVSDSAIDRRLANGLLARQHEGVFVVGGGALRVETRWMAAVLACREGSALSHWDAAALWGLAPVRGTQIHVTVPGRGGSSVRGIRRHRTRVFGDDERTTVDGIPVTTVARLLLDLAPELTRPRLEQLVSDADLRGLFDGRAIQALVERHPTRRGTSAVAQLLAELRGPTVTRSELELRFLELCDIHGLPRPFTNAMVDGHEVDAYWPDANLAVELDGLRWHRTPAQRERDARKRLALEAAGTPVVVLTWAQVTTEARRTAAALTARRRPVP
jgi:hypothetical protein